jgi:hypothetical protein
MFTKACLERLGHSPETIPDTAILSAFEKYAYAKNQIAGIWVLRTLLSKAIESLILLDRLQFCKEQGYECELMSFIDPESSPRNMALLIFKT